MNSQGDVWKFTWNLNIKHKIRRFLWKCLNSTLPTNGDFHKRTGNGNPICSRCDKETEIIKHVFFFFFGIMQLMCGRWLLLTGMVLHILGGLLVLVGTNYKSKK
ncbi:hypothetical protein ACH5RR_009357 [Cinchona calisaya]|uniref:Reverse transcriptase zinc-binding domain-containing protein n=1 Tax=Cinchona calisaya TaxID=153742 RepID=A0ABD3AH98_9GENT